MYTAQNRVRIGCRSAYIHKPAHNILVLQSAPVNYNFTQYSGLAIRPWWNVILHSTLIIIAICPRGYKLHNTLAICRRWTTILHNTLELQSVLAQIKFYTRAAWSCNLSFMNKNVTHERPPCLAIRLCWTRIFHKYKSCNLSVLNQNTRIY